MSEEIVGLYVSDRVRRDKKFSSRSWEVPTGPEPKVHRGRWRAFPYTAERDEEGEAAFWGALCDEWERSDTVEGRRVERFAFYLMQADTLDGEEDGGYGQVRKRLIKRFDCRLRK